MKFRQSLFWDTDPVRIDKDKNALYIIERVLDFGNDEEVKWVYHNYDKSLLKEVVDNPRRLRPESKKLWKLILQS
ncbi:MAG: hypothetical protein Q7R78_00500 [bacterium]|nr:hypothetical protein [bacterium]